MQIRSVGIDLGKTTFHLVALGTSGKVLVKKKFSQKTSDRHGRGILSTPNRRSLGETVARCTYFLCYRGAVTSVPETNASVAAAESVEL
jgi:hypothetical protein